MYEIIGLVISIVSNARTPGKPIEVPLLISTIVATVQIHVAIAVHAQTIVVVFGCLIFRYPETLAG